MNSQQGGGSEVVWQLSYIYETIARARAKARNDNLKDMM